MNEDSKILHQFFRNFIAHEKSKENVSEEYIIFLKIIWLKFYKIIVAGKRKTYILEQIEEYLINDDFQKQVYESELPDIDEESIEHDIKTPFIRLKEIDLVNFRGFQANDNGLGRKIEFCNKTTLFFSPNGGGKTSICEALEWGLTGDTYERRARKVSPEGHYFQNIWKITPYYKLSKIILEYDNVIPNNVFDRCFIEKNRIDKFAKLAIQSSKEFQEALGELFGFSEVADFINGFVQDISPTDREKSSKENWQMWLDWNNKKADQEKSISEAESDEKVVIDEVKELIGDKSIDTKIAEIRDNGEKLKKELYSLEKDFSIEFNAKEFLDNVKSFLLKIAQWKEHDKYITENAKQLDFESLFQAANIIFSKDYKDEKCPLCDTPFAQKGLLFKRSGVVTDPRKKVQLELKKLQKLTEHKNEKTKITAELSGLSFRTLRGDWDNIQHNLKKENWQEIAGNIEKPILPSLDFVELEANLDRGIIGFIEACWKVFNNNFSNITSIEKTIKAYQEKRKVLLKNKPEKEVEIQNLRDTYKKLQDYKPKILAAKQNVEASKAKLAKIIKAEDNAKAFKNYIDKLYPEFHQSIKIYLADVIVKEGSDIDNNITGFYRALNSYDNSCEKIKKVEFPKSKEEKVHVYYEKDDRKACDSLHILSEGHLRTLGFATLLARAMKQSTPLLIFDDAINAIDSDHRDNIACLLTGSLSYENWQEAFGNTWQDVKKYLEDCQFVITTHDRFFDEKIANMFKSDQQKRYVLYSGENGIDFCEKGNPSNFKAKIEHFLHPETQDIRSAIFYCRIWLEELLLSIAINFKKPSNNRPIPFENILDSKTKSLKNPELEILIGKLIRNLNMDGTTDDNKQIASILEDILNEQNGKYVWFFDILNQESHYRRFDHVNISHAPTSNEVNNVFEKIQDIDNLTRA